MPIFGNKKIMNEKHLSDSTPQREVEKNVVESLQAKYDCEFQNKIEGFPFQPDFFNKEKRIVGEIYAGTDKLNSAQKNKIMADCFKLISIEKSLGGEWQKYIVVIDNKIEESLKRDGWRKKAMEEANITLRLEKISEEDENKLREAKKRQQQGMKFSKNKK